MLELDIATYNTCHENHLTVQEDGDSIVVIDRDPAFIRAKKKLPRYVGNDVSVLISEALTDQKNRLIGPPIPEPEEELVIDVTPALSEPMRVDPEPKPEFEPDLEPEEDSQDGGEGDFEPDLEPVHVRRSVIHDDDTELTGVVLDESVPSRRAKKPKKEVRAHRDNRFARAFRAILENPDAPVSELARIADVTEPMLLWYFGGLKSLYRIIYEKHGEGVIPKLPNIKGA